MLSTYQQDVELKPYEDEMLREAEKVLHSAQSALGETHPRAAEALQNLGFYYTAIKNEPDTRLCLECSQAVGGEFDVMITPENLSKSGSLKKNYGSFSIEKKRRPIRRAR